jgi:hypothetical protein
MAVPEEADSAQNDRQNMRNLEDKLVRHITATHDKSNGQN